MAFIPKANTNQGMMVPTTVIYDALRLLESDNGGNIKESLKRLYQSMNIVALAINAREIGLYPLDEFVIGNLYYNSDATNLSELRPIFRRTYNTGPIAIGANTIPHGLTFGNPSDYQFVRIYGAANDNGSISLAPSFYPIPNATIEVSVDALNIVITNGTAVTFTTSSIVLEYSKTGGI